MNWQAIGAIGEILGAVAVVATLAYLAIQVKQTNRATKISSEQAVFTNFVGLTAGMVGVRFKKLQYPSGRTNPAQIG